MGTNDIESVKRKFGFDPTKSFEVEDDVKRYYLQSKFRGEETESKWNLLFESYQTSFPELANEFNRRLNGQLPVDWKKRLPSYHTTDKPVGTRNRSEEVLNAVAEVLPELFGGSADLTGSNLTALKSSGDFQHNTPAGRYVRFGVREHAMSAICNGLFSHGGFRPFGATFLNFIGYALGAVRVSALSRFGILYVMTHDSIGLGEDGPTHQPVEMLETLRCIPNLLTIRPADGNEVVGAYIAAIENSHTPTVISLSRQAVPTLNGTSAEKVSFGAYLLNDYGSNANGTISLIIVST